MGRTPFARRARRVLLLALVSLSWPAFAGVTLSQFPPNPGVLPGGGWSWANNTNFGDPPPPRAWVNGQYGGVPGAKLTVPSTVAGPAGPLTVQVGRTAGNGAIARGLLGVAKNIPQAALAATLAGAAWEWWEANRLKSPGDGSDALHDPGQPPELQTVPQYYCSYSGTGDFGSTPSTACTKAAAMFTGTTQTIYTGSQGTVTQYYSGSVRLTDGFWQMERVESCGGPCWGAPGSTSTWLNMSMQLSGTTQELACPASTGFDYSVPAGLAPGPDGKCATGSYTAPVGADWFQQRATDHPPSDPAAVGEKVLQQGGEIQGEPGGITGPGQQTGTPTTTTTTTSTGTKTQTETKTYNYNYGDSNVTYNTTTTIVTINEDGTTTTTTTNTGTPPGETQDPEDPCVKNPGTLACIKMGEAPTDAVPKVEKNIAFASENLGIAAGCPVPVSLPHGQQISYQTVCDGVEQARPLIIAMGFLMAAGIMLGGFKLE